MSDMMKVFPTLKDGSRVRVYFYAYYEITELEKHPEKELTALPGIALKHILAKKNRLKGLDKEKIAKEASRMAKNIEKRKHPNQDLVGKIQIVIVDDLRKPTIEELEWLKKLKEQEELEKMKESEESKKPREHKQP